MMSETKTMRNTEYEWVYDIMNSKGWALRMWLYERMTHFLIGFKWAPLALSKRVISMLVSFSGSATQYKFYTQFCIQWETVFLKYSYR